MSFGFGIGDIIVCIKLAASAISALKSASAEFQCLRLELTSLTATLKALEDEELCPTSLIHTANAKRREDMRVLLQNCANGMDDLRKLVHQYSTLDYKRRKRLSEWLAFATKDKVGPRDKLALHTASINVFLMTLSHGSLGRLEFLAKHARPSPTSFVPPSSMSGNNATIYSGTRGMGEAYNSTGFSIWEALGKDLYEEGITHQQVEKHQEELKAYLRYLVKGETPFWNSKAGEPEPRCATPGYRSPPTLPNSRSIMEGLERHRKEREIEQRSWTGAASTGQYARRASQRPPSFERLRPGRERPEPRRPPPMQYDDDGRYPRPPTRGRRRADSRYKDDDFSRRGQGILFAPEVPGSPTETFSSSSSGSRKSTKVKMARERRNEEAARRLELESMQEQILQELKVCEAELEKGDKGLKTLAAKKDSYEMKLRRSTESTQKRKLQEKLDEVKRQFLEQEVEVETAKAGVAQRRMLLEEFKLEQAKIDETGRRERVSKGEDPSENDHRTPVLEPASYDDEVEYLLHEFKSLFDLDEDTDLDYNLETEVASPSSAYADSPASQEYNYEDDVVSDMPSEDSAGTKRYNESQRDADKTADRAFAPKTVERIVLFKAALDEAIHKYNRMRRDPDNQRVIEQIKKRDIPNHIAELRKLGCRFTCDFCDLPIAGTRFHCNRCDGGDWDWCEACWEMKGQSHKHDVTRTELEDDITDKIHAKSLYPGSVSGKGSLYSY